MWPGGLWILDQIWMEIFIMIMTAHSTQHHCWGWLREWKGYSNIHSLSPSFYTLPCEVYFQEAISIYKADFNLSIDLCFQGSLRKLFAKEGQRILNVFHRKYVPFCVYKNSKLLSNKDICKIFKHTCVDVAFFLTLTPNILFTFPHITLAGSELNIQVNFNFVKYAQ